MGKLENTKNSDITETYRVNRLTTNNTGKNKVTISPGNQQSTMAGGRMTEKLSANKSLSAHVYMNSKLLVI